MLHALSVKRSAHSSNRNDFTQDSQRNANTNTSTSTVTSEIDASNERIAHAMRLLLDARQRVLTLSEQRVSLTVPSYPSPAHHHQIVLPAIKSLVSAQMITPLDLPPIVSLNTTLAHPLVVALLSNPTSDINLPSPFLDVLPSLPPTLPSFDLLGRLLRDFTMSADGTTTIADLVRIDVLGRFILECINWLDHVELQEKAGLLSDDRLAMGVQHVGCCLSCRWSTRTDFTPSSAVSICLSSRTVLSIQPPTPTPPKFHTSVSAIRALKKQTLFSGRWRLDECNYRSVFRCFTPQVICW